MDQMEKKVIANLDTQSKIVNSLFKGLATCINAYFESSDEMEKSIEKIREYEKKTAKIRKENLAIVAETVSIHRSDFLRLIMKMADVSAHLTGASVRLGHVPYRPRSDDPMIPKFAQLIDTFLQMGNELRNLVRYLGEDTKKAFDQCSKVDSVEETVDNIYRDLHGHLYNRTDIPLRYIMQILSVAKHVEEACDHAASVADSIRIIIAAH
jgi:predicted phosphate transport protein (TIGR00153 family)